MKTMNNKNNNRGYNGPQQYSMDAKWLQDASGFVLEANDVTVTFNDAKPITGDLEAIKGYIKECQGPHIASTHVNGKKASLYMAFRPTNDNQRVFLATKLGVQVARDQLFTFATRHRAMQCYQQMAAIGVKTAEYNWPLVIKLHSEPQQTELLPL